jgi:hypothetical protein
MLFFYLLWFCILKINGFSDVFIVLEGSFLSSIICTMILSINRQSYWYKTVFGEGGGGYMIIFC